MNNVEISVNSGQQKKLEAFKHYTNQPIRLPGTILEQFRAKHPDSTILLYALVDLNEKFVLEESWLMLTPDKLILASQSEQKHIWTFFQIDTNQIGSLHEFSGLSCNRLSFLRNKTEDCLMTIRFTHRQSRAIGVLRFVIEESIKKNEGPNYNEELKNVDADDQYQKNVMQPIEEAQAATSGKRIDVVWRLLSYLYPYRFQVAAGMSGAILMTAVSLVPAYITGYIIDHVVKPFQQGHMTMAEAKALMWTLVIGLTFTYGVREIFGWVRLRTMSVLGEKVARDLRDQVYTHLHKLSLSFFSSKQTGSLISRVSSDTDRIWDFVAFGVVEVATSIIMLLGLSVVLIFLDWPLGLMVSAPVPILLWVIARHGQKMQNLFLRAWRKWSDLTDCLSDTIPGIRVVKAFNREDYETARFQTRNEDCLNEFNRIHVVWTKFWPMLMLCTHLIVVSVWVFGAPRVLEHIDAFKTMGSSGLGVGLTPGTLVTFVMYMGMFINPIEIIGQMARMVNRATSSAQRVFEVLDTEPNILNVEGAKKISTIKGEVKFENVTFSYDGVRKIIKNMSFHVKPGEMIGLVGPSGSGKTTIINLIARFYDITGGNIFVDGHKLSQLDMSAYRNQLGIVLQDPYLFHGSILQNILYSKPEASTEEVVEAAKAANAHDFICQLSHGYETTVGERGHTLSGGERQRVSIARAILRDPKILILDEATSAVDSETERKIQEALDRLVSGRTVFAIAHRLSTLSQADRLLVIKKGEVIEQGRHEELINIPDGTYRKLVNMQKELQKAKGV